MYLWRLEETFESTVISTIFLLVELGKFVVLMKEWKVIPDNFGGGWFWVFWKVMPVAAMADLSMSRLERTMNDCLYHQFFIQVSRKHDHRTKMLWQWDRGRPQEPTLPSRHPPNKVKCRPWLFGKTGTSLSSKRFTGNNDKAVDSHAQ